MDPLTRHVRLHVLLLGTMVLGVAWLGCATSPTDEDTLDPAPPTNMPTAKSAPSEERPAFDAGFADAGKATDAAPDSSGGGGPCLDPGDPGSSENTAQVLPATSDAQNAPIVVNGVLNGSADVDFYKLDVADTFTHLLQPDTQSDTSGFERCVFVKCAVGAPDVTCGGGGVAKKSDVGMDGCCATGPSAATPVWSCSGLDDSATLYIRVKQIANQCLPYSFSYAF